MFPTTDAPRYNTAKIVLIVTMSAVVVLILVLRQVMVWENTKRDKEAGSAYAELENVDFADLTDIENRRFRYVY